MALCRRPSGLQSAPAPITLSRPLIQFTVAPWGRLRPGYEFRNLGASQGLQVYILNVYRRKCPYLGLFEAVGFSWQERRDDTGNHRGPGGAPLTCSGEGRYAASSAGTRSLVRGPRNNSSVEISFLQRRCPWMWEFPTSLLRGQVHHLVVVSSSQIRLTGRELLIT